MIKNREKLTQSENKEARKICLDLIEHAIRKTNPKSELKNNIELKNGKISIFNHEYKTKDLENLYIIGAGKASQEMAIEIEKKLQDQISQGIVITKEGYKTEKLEKINLIEGGHPVPNKKSIEGTKKILEIVEKASEKDLIINLLSGGGSALLTSPAKPITLKDLRKTTKLLLKSGATINEINTIRKHISEVKGGKLAEKANPTPLISLIVSDVVGDKLDIIASGPTVPDTSTYKEAIKILEKYSIKSKTPKSAIKHLKKGARGEKKETPTKMNHAKIENLLISNSDKLTQAAKEKGEELDLNPIIISRMIEGESREIGKAHAGILLEIKRTETPIKKPALLISGGETTVKIEKNPGKGGPNQECALGAAEVLEGEEDIVFAAVDTDGSDGPTDVAGGLVNGKTGKKLKREGLEFSKIFEKHISGSALEKIGDHILTGPTGTNVNDLRIGLVLDK